jgi:predicted SAM-dependent methyltransferase
MVKLNIGCGGDIKQGWVNVDSKDLPGAFMTDARNLHYMFVDVEEIYASHVMEHMLLRDAVDCLFQWARMLTPGGRMEIRVPDMDYAAMLIANRSLVNKAAEKDPKLMFSDVPTFNMIWGDDRESPHRSGFTQEMLHKIFKLLPLDYKITIRDYEGMREIIVIATKKTEIAAARREV